MKEKQFKHIDLFENYSIPKAVATLGIPTMLGMLVAVIYNMTDTFFVGQMGDPNQVAAVSLTMPVFFILMAFGNIFGVGSGTYISRLLGIGDYKKIKNVSSFSFYICIGVGLACMAALYLFMKPVLIISGTSKNTYGFAADYLKIIAAAAPFVCLQQALQQIVRSEGSAKHSMTGMMAGTILNIILDPIFILYFKMGVAGAAIATAIGNIVSVIYFIHFSHKTSDVLSFSLKDYKVTGEIMKNIFSIGIPASLNNILMSASFIMLNKYALKYGDNVIAALGISTRIVIFPAVLILGLALGIQPFVAYNYSAKNYTRMNHSIIFSCALSIIWGLIFTFIFYSGAETIVRIFLDNDSVVAIGAKIFRITSLTLPIVGIMFILTFVFQGLGKAKQALILSISRQGLCFVPVLIAGSMFFGLDGIIWAQPISDTFTAVIAGLMYFITYKRSIKNLSQKTESFDPLTEPLQNE